MRRIFSSVISVLFSLLLLVAVVTGLVKRQTIYDWWVLRGYQPSAAITDLARDTTMNDSTRRVFYANRPSLQSKQAFYDSCREDEEKTPVLGCYINGEGIYILDVDDPRLEGVEQATSAHELLHSAYDRLSGKERTQVNELIDSTYKSLNDERISKKLDLYKAAKADLTNELHSILGTEVESLPEPLERYYSRYFNNRKKLVAYFNAYQAEFTTRKDKLDATAETLKVLESRINESNDELNTEYESIQTAKQSLDRLKQNNDIDSYNAGVAPYNARVQAYNSKITVTKGLVNQYKETLETYNRLAEEAQELSKALDSRISTREQL